MTDAEYEEVARSILNTILSDPKLCFPRYRADIKTEAQANEATDLPLVYTWNEIVKDSQLLGFSLSVNGKIIGSMLEKQVPRTDPTFTRLRDFIINLLAKAQNNTVQNLCQQFQRTPRQLSELMPS